MTKILQLIKNFFKIESPEEKEMQRRIKIWLGLTKN